MHQLKERKELEQRPVGSVQEMPDGLYKVNTPYLCAGFVVVKGVVTACAPILRNKIDYWKTQAKLIK